MLLVFARLGAALMTVPGFGEQHVLPRLRLLLALALSILVSPALAGTMPMLPREPLALLGLLVPEILVGLLLGFVDAAGAGRDPCRRVADRPAVGPVRGGDVRPERGDPGHHSRRLPGSGGAHRAVRRRLPPSAAARDRRELHGLPGRDCASTLRPPAACCIRLSGDALATGARIAAPLILAGILVNLGLGAMGRMVPSFPIFFLALPVQLLLALAVLELSLPAAMTLFGEAFVRGVGWLEPAG